MRIAYLDCFAGISGDMFLGALIDAGVDPRILQDAAAAMRLGAALRTERVDRSGIASIKVHVLEGDELAETTQHNGHDEGPLEQATQPGLSPNLKTQHLHKTGHADTRDSDWPRGEQEHTHGRSLSVIRELIQGSGLDAPVVRTAIRAFELLGRSEAKIHNVPVERIHFHEVGAVDAIVDIVAASAGFHALDADKWVASPVNVGGGMVKCMHGRFPVPAPATADLLLGIPTYSADVQMELVTPTGASLLRVLVEDEGLRFGPQPAMRVDRIGYGAGSRNPHGFPNVLRLSVGESDEDESSTKGHPDTGTVTVIEAAIDDLSPQILAHVAEVALEQGALDVMLTPVIMKKGRSGTLLTVLCHPARRSRMEELLLRETSTLGVRARDERRSCLDRSFKSVVTPYGAVRIKLGTLRGETINANPEFEDCRAAAAAYGVPVKAVHQAAIAAYLASGESDRRHG